jgi:hypothetical protein
MLLVLQQVIDANATSLIGTIREALKVQGGLTCEKIAAKAIFSKFMMRINSKRYKLALLEC